MTKSMVTVSVKCADEVAKLNISPEDFQFVEFKAWLHGRFTISPESQLVFSDNSGAGSVIYIGSDLIRWRRT